MKSWRKVKASACVLAVLAGGANHALAQSRTPSSEAGTPGLPPSPEVLSRGQDIMEELGWPSDFGYGVEDEVFTDLTKSSIFNGLYGRPGLTRKERELIIIALIIASGSGSLLPHLTHAAPLTGVSEENFREVIVTACFYAGWPKCSSAQHSFNEIFPVVKDKWPAELLRPIEPELPNR